MTDALVAAGPVIVLAAVLAFGAEALRAVLDGRLAGAPASITVLAPLAETARLLRRRGTARVRFAGVGLLAAAGVQVAVAAGAPVWWLGATVLLRWIGVWTLRRASLRAPFLVLLAELVLAASVAAPVLAAQAVTAAGIAAAQQPTWFAATMPVALLGFVVASAATRAPLTPSVDRVGGGSALVPAGRSLLVASAMVLAVPLFLGGGSWAVVTAKAAVLTVVVVVVGRRFPRLGARTLPLWMPCVALLLALLQLAVVRALGQLG